MDIQNQNHLSIALAQPFPDCRTFPSLRDASLLMSPCRICEAFCILAKEQTANFQIYYKLLLSLVSARIQSDKIYVLDPDLHRLKRRSHQLTCKTTNGEAPNAVTQNAIIDIRELS